ISAISRRFAASPTKVSRGGRRFQEIGSYTRRAGQGCRRSLIHHQDRYLVLSATGVNVSAQTLRNRLCLRPDNWCFNHWHPVLFTGESRFAMSTCDRQERVSDGLGRHIHGKSHRPAIRYQDETLEHTVRYYTGAVGPGFLLVYNNASCGRACRQFLKDKGIDTINCPPHSPNLNPLEQLWDVVSRSIQFHQVAPQTVQELPQETICSVTGSMHHCQRGDEHYKARPCHWHRA
uniref:Tc1-like transposase DDE domain-containing protein n=1 Tax=Maylandia zebra TaxID=106582 RepID=A0A3P9DLB6_9CICH